MKSQTASGTTPGTASGDRKSTQVQWGKLIVKLTLWAASELLLGWVGLDNLADYGEFVLGDASHGPALYQIQPAQQGGLDLMA